MKKAIALCLVVITIATFLTGCGYGMRFPGGFGGPRGFGAPKGFGASRGFDKGRVKIPGLPF